jgi:hypothetical protein
MRISLVTVGFRAGPMIEWSLLVLLCCLAVAGPLSTLVRWRRQASRPHREAQYYLLLVISQECILLPSIYFLSTSIVGIPNVPRLIGESP